jgi:hypothetical protein
MVWTHFAHISMLGGVFYITILALLLHCVHLYLGEEDGGDGGSLEWSRRGGEGLDDCGGGRACAGQGECVLL